MTRPSVPGIRKRDQVDTKRMTKAMARKLLTPADYRALPFLKKKYNNPDSPENGMWQEDRIVKHIVDRLMLSDIERMTRIFRMRDIDVQLSGVVRLDQDDKKRDKDNKAGKAPKPIKHNLSLAYSQIDDLITYLMSLYAPEMNIFIATSTANKQSVAEGLTKEIGKHGQTLGYYRQFCKFLLNSAKYNLGAVSVRWEKCSGVVYQPGGSDPQSRAMPGQIVAKPGTVWEGNVLKSCDMYNFLYDTSVHPCDLPLRGEYFAEIELQTPFRIRRMNDQDILFGIERYINSSTPMANTNNASFYRIPPIVREPGIIEGGGSTNWKRIFNAGGPAIDSQLGIELAWYTTWIRPSEFDLSDSDKLECWQIVMANGKYITAAYEIKQTHGQLPVAAAAPIEDDLQNDQRTYAEMLLPLQHFASFLLNTHVDATRKAIYGITVFDKNAFPGLDLSTEDLIGARIPMKSNSQGIDIDKMFRHYNDAPQTDQNVEMVGKIIELMQKILPTNQAQQVADLQRATEYQAAATVQASSRRNLKIARIINDQAITPIKFQMMYNIYENVPVIKYTGVDGKEVDITPQALLEAAIEFDIGTGLKGLDRLMQISIFKDLMGYLFQVKGMDQQVDLLGLLSYVTQIAGFETDLSQFRWSATNPNPSQPANVIPNGGPATAPANTSQPVASAPANIAAQ